MIRKLIQSVVWLASLSTAAQAAVVLNSTRYIYKASDKEISIRLANVGETPALMQLWIDLGDTTASPSDIEAPFLISSPLLRINSKQNQNVRVIYTGDKLPQDRESLFWLNALEIPPKPDEQEVQNYLQFTVRTRVKLFYRPTALKGGVVQAVPQVIVKVLKKDPYQIQITNPTPFYVSFSEIWLKRKGEKLGDGIFGMVDPFGSLTLEFNPIKEDPSQGLAAEAIDLNALDEYGANVLLSVPIE